MNTLKLLRSLAKRFPKSLKDRGDRVGLMTGKLKEDTFFIVLCLDLDEISFNRIKKFDKKPDLILTHHPFIYGTKYRVFLHDEIKKALCEEVDRNNIPVYSMHTNFDTGRGGMNDALAEALELSDIKPLEHCKMARGGKLPHAMEIHEFAKYVNKKLELDYSQLVHAGKDTIETVAIVGGGGSRRNDIAQLEGYDIFISGDAPHYVRRDVIARHYNYLEVCHEVEKIFMKQMKKLLLEIDPTLRVETIDHEELPELIK